MSHGTNEAAVSLAMPPVVAPPDHELFVPLSVILTGLALSELPASVEQRDQTGARVKLHEVYFSRLNAAYPREFRELLAAWRTVQATGDPEATLTEKLQEEGDAALRLRLAARQVIKIWYLSTIDDPKEPLDPKKKGLSASQLGGDIGQYQLSAVWKILGAPVPGYSPNSHGYWALKPIL